MASPILPKSYKITVPVGEQGLEDAWVYNLKLAVVKAVAEDNLKIKLIFESNQPKNPSAVFKQEMRSNGTLYSVITFYDLQENHQTAIKKVFKSMGISINLTVLKNPEPDPVAHLRGSFPGKSDEWLREKFNLKHK